MKKLLFLIISIWAVGAWAQTPEIEEFEVKATAYYAGVGRFGKGTSSGKRIEPSKVKSGEHRWVALPPRLRKQAGISFGDTIIVTGATNEWVNGLWVVEDHMSNRLNNHIDFLIHRSEARNFRNCTIKFHKKAEGEVYVEESETANDRDWAKNSENADADTAILDINEATDCAANLKPNAGDNDKPSDNPEPAQTACKWQMVGLKED